MSISIVNDGNAKNDYRLWLKQILFSFVKKADDTNKGGEVDKYQLFVTGLQALGATEQQIYDCFAGAKPANMWDNMNPDCNYSKCVGEKILIW